MKSFTLRPDTFTLNFNCLFQVPALRRAHPGRHAQALRIQFLPHPAYVVRRVARVPHTEGVPRRLLLGVHVGQRAQQTVRAVHPLVLGRVLAVHQRQLLQPQAVRRILIGILFRRWYFGLRAGAVCSSTRRRRS